LLFVTCISCSNELETQKGTETIYKDITNELWFGTNEQADINSIKLLSPKHLLAPTN